ncbi:diguanylate cyclase (GGDEF)-like protein/PAS domain S-box-containing protein [Actimicrobium sp. GrIS 1.19]|uniref:PAS domain-containing protein n=1 Tax=Actimicrobium sp. GrIS 1.19 TaxID=3071708 RepID=UPI002E07E4EE|nr:diguanylate cyclase (GGDEF)-like protein/PAS domain S-box-containing protein [Actimicrobium sp. GrIS 1.19]
MPISLLSLVDAERQWFKSNYGLGPATQTPRDASFCAHAILGDSIFEVQDTLTDPRFADNPLVIGDPGIRFYAGASLVLSDGAHVGTLCVIGREPSVLSSVQREVLGNLARVAVLAMESRHITIQRADSEARFRALSEASPLGIYATDVKGACVYTNAKWQAIYGLSEAQSLGTGWTAAVHPEDKAAVFAEWQACADSGQPFAMDFRLGQTGGSLRVIHSTARQTVDEHGVCTGYVGTVDDITEKSEVKYINESMLSMIKTHRIVSFTDLSGAITEVNDAFCDISGYSRDELMGKNHSVINSGTHPAAFFTALWRSLKRGESWQGEICNRAKDGQLYWVDSIIAPLRGADGTIERYVSIRTDITERKRQSEELRKSQEFLSQTGRLAGVGGWEVDILAGIVYWSDETCRIHEVEPGYQPVLSEAINFYAPEAQPVIQKAVEEGIAFGKDWDLELPMITAIGKRIWVRAVGHVEFANNAPRRLVGAFQDITEAYLQRQQINHIRNRFVLATQSGGIGVWDYNLVDETLAWSAEMYLLYGLPPTNETGVYELWSSHLHADDKANAEAALQAAIQGKSDFQPEFRVIWNDGSIHFIRAAAIVERDDSGKALRMVGVNWDITAQRNAESALAQKNDLLRVTMESIGDSVITTDAKGCVSWLNPVAERMTGWTNSEASGRPLAQVFHIVNEQTRLPTENPVDTCLKHGKMVGLANHTLLISRHGEEFGIEDSAAPIRNAVNDVLGVVLVFHNVTEQRRMSGEMSFRATHDELTGLVNRAEFEARLRRLLQKSHEDGSHHALMYIDLDQFKLVNDACGHSAGDQLLQQVSKLLGEGVRARDTLARLGGDEFGVILDHCTTEQAQRVAQKICDRMEEFRFLHDGRRFRIGTSIGLVAVSNAFATVVAVMQAADTSCYAAKEAGRNRVHTWFDTDQARRERHGEMQWTTRIEQALDEDKFVLYAQRITALDGDKHGTHAEVLLRMVDHDGSIIGPAAFIPAAERFNLASRIDRWVLRNATAWLEKYADQANVETLSVNLSGQSVGDRAFHRHVIEKLAALRPNICKRLCFEITETAAVTNLADAALFIEQVRALGVRISLDDFGAGASSFGYLKSLRVDYLKIDGQFIKGLVDDPLDDAAVRCFVDVARVVGVKTVAEYVDGEAVLQRVQALGIDYAQGFHLHKPEPIDQLVKAQELQPQLV